MTASTRLLLAFNPVYCEAALMLLQDGIRRSGGHILRLRIHPISRRIGVIVRVADGKRDLFLADFKQTIFGDRLIHWWDLTPLSGARLLPSG